MEKDICLVVNNNSNKIISNVVFIILCKKYKLNINLNSSALDLLDEIYLKLDKNSLLGFMNDVEINSEKLFGERK